MSGHDPDFAFFIKSLVPRDSLVVAIHHVYLDESGTNRDARQAHLGAFGAPDRAVAIPNMCGCAGEGWPVATAGAAPRANRKPVITGLSQAHAASGHP